MVRAPRFEKTGLKKGAWSPEEDQKLTAYIKRYGIWNWSEMSKPAGLLRSGKSCRLRWVNYLRPDITRGNFSKEEDETILKLHELLGNRWSAIAARLPGRTDNEIKNYWHTRNAHLKKRMKENPTRRTKSEAEKASSISEANQKKFSEINLLLPNALEASKLEGSRNIPISPQSTGEFSPSSTDPALAINEIETIEWNICSSETFGELQSLWAEPLSVENLYIVEDRATFANPGYLSPTSQTWHTSPFGSLETFDELQSLWTEPLSVDNFMVEDQATFADPAGYISPISQMWIQEHMNTPFGSYSDASIDFWIHLLRQAEMGGI